MPIQITNQATVTYQSGRDEKKASSNIAAATLEGPLTVSKNVLGNIYRQGAEITYLLTTMNNGTTTLDHITISDRLGTEENQPAPLDYVGPAILYVNGNIDNRLGVQVDHHQVIFTIPTLSPQANALIIYRAKPNAYAPLACHSTITNAASWQADTVNEMISDHVSVQVASEADVQVIKTMYPNPITAGSAVTYTFHLSNSGNIPAQDIVLKDNFTPPLTDITVTFNHEILPSTGYTYEDGVLCIENRLFVPAATYTRENDGIITTIPGTAIITVSGTI